MLVIPAGSFDGGTTQDPVTLVANNGLARGNCHLSFVEIQLDAGATGIANGSQQSGGFLVLLSDLGLNADGGCGGGGARYPIHMGCLEAGCEKFVV